jgi:putative ubiquitin-RnfH superfamily antitoxin RatB of RatAB toxin-antitoxin module
MDVEVVYAEPSEQVVVVLRVAPGTTAREAVLRSGLLSRFPEIHVDRDGLGVFGVRVEGEHVLRHGDRVEIYRPLVVDPKEARRRRAAHKRARQRP